MTNETSENSRPGHHAASSAPDSASSDLVQFRQLTNVHRRVMTTLLQSPSLNVRATCRCNSDSTARFLVHLPEHTQTYNHIPLTWTSLCFHHSLANRHSCLTPAKNEGIDIDSPGPIAEGMIIQQTIFVYP